MMLLLLIAVVVLCLVYYLVRYLVELRGLPPGPWGLPVLGSLLRLSPTTPYLSLTQLADKYGPIYSLQMGRVLAVVLSDVRLIREVLGKDEMVGRADLYLTHGIMEGYGLVCSEGKRWREQRSFVTSTLKTLGMVKFGDRRDRLEARILEGVIDVVEYLKTQDGKEVDTGRTFIHSIGNVMNSLLFGRRWDWNDSTWRWLQHLNEEGVKHIGVAGPLNFLPFLRIIPKYRRLMDFIIDGKNDTHKVYQQVIDDHPPDKEDDFIAAFLREQRARGADSSSFTQKQFYHLLGDLFGAGVDTTMVTLRWFLICVAQHQDVQKRIQTDLDSIDGGTPRLEHADRLQYLKAAIAETQRIRPVVPVGIPRGVTDDTMVAGYRIPRGTMVIPLQWAVHMDSRNWPQPERFNPDRFLNADGKFFKPDGFIPFQTGKRACMGEELARMVLLLYTSNLLYNFNVTLPASCRDPLDSHCGITLTPTLQTLVFHRRTREE